MEDETRPVPEGWVRQFDPKTTHQYYVDTRATPPRSVWHHPYDDEQFMSSLPSEERERIEELNRHPSRADIMSMSSSEDLHAPDAKSSGASADKKTAAGVGASSSHPPAYDTHTAGYHAGPSNAPPPKGMKKFGRNLKDKLTGTTHEQREKERQQRAIEEQREYEMHVRIRNAMAKAFETGQPQLLGRDKDGKDVYVEPPNYGGGRYGNGGYGFNPYGNMGGGYGYNAAYQPGRYAAPGYAYSRPQGYGYGGGYGLPIAGGLLGGALLGGLLF